MAVESDVSDLYAQLYMYIHNTVRDYFRSTGNDDHRMISVFRQRIETVETHRVKGLYKCEFG